MMTFFAVYADISCGIGAFADDCELVAVLAILQINSDKRGYHRNDNNSKDILVAGNGRNDAA